jgi:hypothetical protein
VTGKLPYDDVLAKIKKTGKEVSLVLIVSIGVVYTDTLVRCNQVKSGETLPPVN